MRSQRLLTSAGVSATASAKMCGCRRMSLTSMSCATLARSPAPSSLEHEGEQHDLQQQVAELAVLRAQVAGGDGVGQLVDLLHRVADDVLRRLLAVPRALHAQHVDDALERDELLAEQGVVEGLAGRDGDELDGRRAGRAAAPEATRRRSSRASCGPPGPASATTTSPPAARPDELVEPLAVGRVELEQAAEAGVGGLGDELPELALEAGRDEDGAAAGEGPQRCCGRQSGGGADVHEREAHRGGAPRVAGCPYSAAGEAEAAGAEAAGLGEAVSSRRVEAGGVGDAGGLHGLLEPVLPRGGLLLVLELLLDGRLGLLEASACCPGSSW